MQPVGTVVAFGAAPTKAVAALDSTALASDVLPAGEDLFPRLKRARGGSLLLLLAEESDDPALAAAAKGGRILRRRGGGDLPHLRRNPFSVRQSQWPRVGTLRRGESELTELAALRAKSGRRW